MSICTGVIIAVTFHKVDCTPNTKTCTKCDNECLKNAYCAVKKCHLFLPPINKFVHNKSQGFGTSPSALA